MTLLFPLLLLALAATLALAAYLWRLLETARLMLADLDVDLARLTVDVPRERLERRRVAR